jgi:hypothetical protein
MIALVVLLSGTLFVGPVLSALTNNITITSSGQIVSPNVTALSGSAADIQTAVDLVVQRGGVGNVYIPEGTWNFVEVGEPWHTVVVPCGVNIIGATTQKGSDGQVIEWKTVLVMPYEVPSPGSPDVQLPWFKYVINQNVQYNKFRFSEIKLVGWRFFDNSSTTMYTGVSIVSQAYMDGPTAGVRDFRIDHCNFQDMGGSGVWVLGGDDLRNRRAISGVIDHNKFVNTCGDPGFMHYDERTLGYGIGMRRWACDVWENASDVWGKYNNYTIVIEDNYFSKWRHATCSNDGIHQIVRYNTFDGSYGHGTVDGHGSYADEVRTYAVGTRCMEVYNNMFLNYDDTWNIPWVVNIRGGSALVYNNILDGTYPYLLDLNNDWGNYDDLAFCAVNQTYIWNNQLNGGTIIHYNADSKVNVNYFLRSPSLALDGIEYTPLQYPHPLTLE